MSFDTSPCKVVQPLALVSIPLEQGNVFRPRTCHDSYLVVTVSIPLEQGNVFRHAICWKWTRQCMSQSLWNRAMSFDLILRMKYIIVNCLNPFGTGQCLSTAVGCSSLVWQGFPEPLPNFFWCLKSQVLIWLNIERFLSFLFFQNSVKSAVYFNRVFQMRQSWLQ